ncbi:DMT family transporter [uncultured Pelagimonas sp.]|uniref:DMT family transporter n=1 Tax=uncultured Pelagimonas sp. TaxID=1618102 RepID=UPI00260B5EE1|nr:DMT family transporter [uncultured Pelagimonas sp.]
MTSEKLNLPAKGIMFILIGTAAISVNDLLVKMLSDGYPLHQTIWVRSFVGLLFTLLFLKFEGGFAALRTSTPGIHALRGALIVFANMTFYAAVAVMPLGQATALFFVAPLFITLLSIPILGEKVGILRLAAVLVGLIGVVIVQQPWSGESSVPLFVLFLPVIAAFLYAFTQVLTRKLGVSSPASALAFYIQSTFLVVSTLFFLVAGDGRYAEGIDNDSVTFLLRAWRWPDTGDIPVFIGLGLCSGAIGYCLSAAYRSANAATIAPFEYIGLPLAIFWGWMIFGEWPDVAMWIGCTLIIAAGLFVFLREQIKNRPLPGRRKLWGRR